MPPRGEKLQWALTFYVTHAPSFGHRCHLLTQRQGFDPQPAGSWSWKGLGVPDAILSDVATRVHAVVYEHLVTRYGVQEELPFRWAGDPDPF